MAAGDVPTAAGHVLRGAAKPAAGKSPAVRRRWICQRCEAVIAIALELSMKEAAAELTRLAEEHGGAACPK